MFNVFITSPGLFIKINSNNLYMKSIYEEKVVDLRKVRSIYILSNVKLPETVLKSLADIPVFKINGKGNLSFVRLPKRRYKKLKNPEKIIKYIFQVSVLQGKAFVKNLKSSDRRMFRDLKFFEDYEELVYKNRFLAGRKKGLTVEEIYTIIDSMQRRIINNSIMNEGSQKCPIRRELTFKMFHSFYISHIIAFLVQKGVSPQQNFIKNEKFPDFAKMLFLLFKLHSSMLALRTYEDILIEKDFLKRFDFEMTTTGKVIVAKLFSEKFVHNPSYQEKLELFLNDLLKIK